MLIEKSSTRFYLCQPYLFMDLPRAAGERHAMCYVAGLGNMSFRRFLLANVLGRGIAGLLTGIVGAYGKQAPALIWIAVIGFIALGIIGWFAMKRHSKFKDAG